MRRIPFAAAICLFFINTTAMSETLMQDTIYLEEVTVSGAVEDDLKSSEAKVVEKKRSNNIADFLAKDPEINLTRKSSVGDGTNTLTIRGQSSERIQVNIDGVNMNSTGNIGAGYIDFNMLPLDNIERIEVIKGGSSAEYGNVIGGVINAYTAHPTSKPKASIYATMGGWDEADDFYNIRGSYSQMFGNFGVSLGMSRQEADEYFKNSDYKVTHIAPKFFLRLPWKAELTAGVDYTKSRRGMIIANVPGTADYDSDFPTIETSDGFAGGGGPDMTPNEGAYQEKERFIYNAAYTQDITDNAFFELSAYKVYEDRTDKNFAAKDSNNGLVQDGDVIYERELEMDRSYGFKAKTEVKISDHTVLFGAERKNLHGGETDIKVSINPNNGNQQRALGKTDSKQEIITDGVFLADSWDINSMFTLDLGVRYDTYETENFTHNFDDSKLSPKAGLTYTITPQDKAAVYMYQSYRIPTMPDTVHYANGDAVDELRDRGIKPEEVNALDFVYRHDFSGKGFVKFSAWYYDIDNYSIRRTIPTTADPATTVNAQYNVDNAEFIGTSLGGEYKVLSSLTLNAGVSYQKSEKSGDPTDKDFSSSSDEVDNIPEYKGNAGFVWKITDKLTFDMGLNYIGERPKYEDGKKKTLSSYTLADASIAYEVVKNTVLEVYADNIFDKKYEEASGYESMGFNAGASVRWTY
ncbi:TonB-dependent receptor [Geovibrio thiophilus]|uniref:TonB-dependent receptor n=1 Tax=Geovibrio thiophilus TaxID=139438 RepID=A0A410JY74_9BACT|nr:TonB-dependent receptor [Geovibrio thiophilus]QAR33117.1 TonB-dependent receptor [Geovibrio thiophilus]